MTDHPMAQPWLNWQSTDSFPTDGKPYLVINDRMPLGFPHIVNWKDGRLFVSTTTFGQADISYPPNFFTHWAEIPLPDGLK